MSPIKRMTSAFSSAGDRSSRVPGGDMPLQNLKSHYAESPDLPIFTRAVSPCPPRLPPAKPPLPGLLPLLPPGQLSGYVAIGRTKASILRESLESTIGYVLIGVSAVLGFILLTLLALHRTQREQTALAQARDAASQHAALEMQLHQAQKVEAVALLTAGIAHDFNNLLTIVSANIALLQQQLDTPTPRQQKFLASANSACERAAALTRRLLSFARREPVDPQPTDANQIVSGLADLPWRMLGDRIELTLRLSPDLWPVIVDPFDLENALVNLAINARDAMVGAGRLMVETLNCQFDDVPPDAPPGTAGGDYVLIAVSDTGCGMT